MQYVVIEAMVPCPPGLKSTTSTRSSNSPHTKRTRTGDPDCYRILWGGDQTEVVTQATADAYVGHALTCAMGSTALVAI
jgi:hypothetical protein